MTQVFMIQDEDARSQWRAEGTMDLDTLIYFWTEVAHDPDHDRFDELAEKFPEGCMAINGDKAQCAKWLKQLQETGAVSDTEENLCWAIAIEHNRTVQAIEQEIKRWE